MSVETVARRYASALSDVVIKTGDSQVVQAELKSWEEMIASNTDLTGVFGNPAIALNPIPTTSIFCAMRLAIRATISLVTLPGFGFASVRRSR